MTDRQPPPASTRVRPALRRTATVLVIILLPLAAHALWDFVEMRRLVREIEAIRSKGEPVTEQEAGRTYAGSTDEHRRASRYYLAAAMLALDSNRQPSEITELHEWLSGATPLRTSQQEILGRLTTFLDGQQDTLALVDTANRLPFRGFSPGTEYNYRTQGLWRVAQLTAARTLYLSLAGQLEQASQSALDSLKVRRVLRDSNWFLLDGGHEIPAILSLSTPSLATLERLQAALEAEEGSYLPEERIAAQRAWAIETIWRRYYGIDPRAPRNYSLPMRSVLEWVWRPWFTHEVVGALRGWAELVEAARKPWPEKIKATGDVARRYPVDQRARPGLWPYRGDLMRNFVGLRPQGVDSSALIVDRCSRVALAVERFRRDHGGALPRSLQALVPDYIGTVPLDPASGKPLLYRQQPDAYVVYSVGPDEKDDAGDLSSELQQVIKRGWGRRIIAGRDVGVRVVLH